MKPCTGKSTCLHFPKDSLAFLPVLVDVGQNKKVEILEADLEDYPGMYLDLNNTGKGFKGVFAPYPLETKLGGYGNINIIPVKRADYIAKTNGKPQFSMAGCGDQQNRTRIC